MDGRPSKLEQVSDIYSVSGGSILAGHMLSNWDLYVGSDKEFEAAVDEVLAFARRNVRDRIIRRWLLTGIFSGAISYLRSKSHSARTHNLQRQCAVLVGDKSLGHAYQGYEGPKFHFLTTGLNSGRLCAFSGTDFEAHTKSDPDAAEFYSAEKVELAFAVAASSAFPPMFPPLELEGKWLDHKNGNIAGGRFLLSDGGVFDNTGLEKFWIDHPDEAANSELIVSDAGSPFKSNSKSDFADVLGRNMRASDILMYRVAQETAEGLQKGQITLIKPDQIAGRTLPQSVQARIKHVRTDLDTFDGNLSKLLLEHGWTVAYKQLNLGKPSPWYEWPRVEEDHVEEHLKQRLESSSKRSFLGVFFDKQDWLALIALWGVVGLVLFASVNTVFVYLEERNAQIAAQDAKQEADRANLERLETILQDATSAYREQDQAALGAILTSALEDAQGEIDGTEPSSALDEMIEGYQDLQDSLGQESDTLKSGGPRVFIQFAGFQRETITKLNASLSNAGWNMQGQSGERLGRAAGLREIRYSGDNEEAAERLAQAIDDQQILRGPVKITEMSIVSDDVLEVWISQ